MPPLDETSNGSENNVLMIRVDHISNKKFYETTICSWMKEFKLNGRLLSMGKFWFLIVEGSSDHCDSFMQYYSSREVDINSSGKACKDQLYDFLGRKAITTLQFKDFHEMNILNQDLLEKLIVKEWNLDKLWLEKGLATSRTKAFIAWKNDAKEKRKEMRKRKAVLRDEEKSSRKKNISK